MLYYLCRNFTANFNLRKSTEFLMHEFLEFKLLTGTLKWKLISI